MNVLGIETSCDETAAAVVSNGRKIYSNVVTSSLKEHTKFGGIIPEIASRRQLEFINYVVNQALVCSKQTLKTIDGIAVTTHPGLIGSLLVGTSFAKSLSLALSKPLVEVNHIEAHLYANFLYEPKNKKSFKEPKLPAIGLVVSGGHTSLFYLKTFNRFKEIGKTLDDAAGEAFDKVARILDLGYPGGPAIEQHALRVKKSDIQFTAAQLPDTLDFSFSGIKTAVLYHKRNHKNGKIPKARVAHAFEQAVVDVLVKKAILACQRFSARTLLIGGGVAANMRLRQRLKRQAKEHDIKVYIPPFSLCLDNAAMIAGLGYHQFKKVRRKSV